MTVEAMITELKASLGNRNDISNARYASWLSWAQEDICGFHRKRQFPPVRFRELEKDTLFKISTETGDCGASSSVSQIQLDSGSAEGDADYYNDRVVELTAYDESGAGQDTPSGLLNQKRVIWDYAGSASYLADVWPDLSVAPDSYTDYTIYQRVFSLVDDVGIDPDQVVHAVEKIERIDTGAPLKFKSWEELTGKDFTNVTDDVPTSFARWGDSLIFDPTPSAECVLRVYYYKYPSEITITGMTTATPELPRPWHRVILAGAVWQGFEKLLEPIRSSEARARYVDQATGTVSSVQAENRHVQRSIGVKVDRVRTR